MAPQAFVTGMPTFASKTTFTAPFVCNRPVQHFAVPDRRAQWTMAKTVNTSKPSKTAKFGPFTPAVIATKFVIGDKNLNKLRGKGIALHSQAITTFCEVIGAESKTRQSLIRAAKKNGNTLGFLS